MWKQSTLDTFTRANGAQTGAMPTVTYENDPRRVSIGALESFNDNARIVALVIARRAPKQLVSRRGDALTVASLLVQDATASILLTCVSTFSAFPNRAHCTHQPPASSN